MIFDLHNDILTASISHGELESSLIDYCSSNHIKKVTLAAFTTKMTKPIEMILQLFSLASKFPNDSRFLFSVEDLHFINSNNFDFFPQIKSRFNLLYAGLTWNHENALAGGALSSSRLTPLGKDVIRALEESNIYIDTAHLNRESFFDVVSSSNKTLINSHACFCGVNEHARNLTDDQIKAIIERDGIIGLTLVPEFLSKKPASLVDSFNHLDYFISRFGYRNLAIGSDFYGCTAYPDGLTSYADFNNLENLMKENGYPPHAIEAIFFKNAQRLLQPR